MQASLTGHQVHEQPVTALSAAALCAPAVPPVTCDSRCVVCRACWAGLTYCQGAGVGWSCAKVRFMCVLLGWLLALNWWSECDPYKPLTNTVGLHTPPGLLLGVCWRW